MYVLSYEVLILLLKRQVFLRILSRIIFIKHTFLLVKKNVRMKNPIFKSNAIIFQ
jgi:hypothetical protein